MSDARMLRQLSLCSDRSRCCGICWRGSDHLPSAVDCPSNFYSKEWTSAGLNLPIYVAKLPRLLQDTVTRTLDSSPSVFEVVSFLFRLQPRLLPRPSVISFARACTAVYLLSWQSCCCVGDGVKMGGNDGKGWKIKLSRSIRNGTSQHARLRSPSLAISRPSAGGLVMSSAGRGPLTTKSLCGRPVLGCYF
jgi:hypothetical protein